MLAGQNSSGNLQDQCNLYKLHKVPAAAQRDRSSANSIGAYNLLMSNFT